MAQESEEQRAQPTHETPPMIRLPPLRPSSPSSTAMLSTRSMASLPGVNHVSASATQSSQHQHHKSPPQVSPVQAGSDFKHLSHLPAHLNLHGDPRAKLPPINPEGHSRAFPGPPTDVDRNELIREPEPLGLGPPNLLRRFDRNIKPHPIAWFEGACDHCQAQYRFLWEDKYLGPFRAEIKCGCNATWIKEPFYKKRELGRCSNCRNFRLRDTIALCRNCGKTLTETEHLQTVIRIEGDRPVSQSVPGRDLDREQAVTDAAAALAVLQAGRPPVTGQPVEQTEEEVMEDVSEASRRVSLDGPTPIEALRHPVPPSADDKMVDEQPEAANSLAVEIPPSGSATSAEQSPDTDHTRHPSPDTIGRVDSQQDNGVNPQPAATGQDPVN